MSTAQQQRYNVMSHESRCTTDPMFSDVPALQCCGCNKYASFGGVISFEEGQFTVADVCMCWPVVSTEG